MSKHITEADIRNAFAATTRELRRKLGVAQEEFAHIAGIDRSYMGALERGERNPSLYTVYRLLPAFGISAPEFFTEFDRRLRKNRH